MRESEIEQAVCGHARTLGWYSIKLNGPGDRGKPDRMFYAKGGRIKFVEFKAPGKTATKLQMHTLGRLATCDFDSYIIDNVADGKALFN